MKSMNLVFECHFEKNRGRKTKKTPKFSEVFISVPVIQNLHQYEKISNKSRENEKYFQM